MGLKILHVGNIAQNAYVNASILSARGHDCDVIASDVYHAHSSPEWYELSTVDVDVSRFGDDPFFPDFYALGRGMPRVGDGVAQGPLLVAIQYLILRRRGDPLAHAALSTLAYLRFKATVQRTTAPFAIAMSDDEFEAHLARYDLRPYLRRRIRAGRTADRYWTWIRSRVMLQDPSDYVRGWNLPLAADTLDHYLAADSTLAGVVHGLRARGLGRALGLEFAGPLTDYEHLESRGFTATEVMPYCWTGLALRELAALYDLCIFYGDIAKFAFAAGIDRYWALEHGTIRTMPFEPTTEGRMIAEAFLNAERVFLTNTDYATAQPRLEFAPEQRIYSPHPFDEAPAFAFRRAYVPRRDPDRAVFFCPARQDWRSGDPVLAKGNHLYFEAGRLLLDQGRTDFVFQCVDWGVDREASRALVADLGLGDHVRWCPLLPKRKLWAATLDAHAVIDQFVVSALGGAGFETLALGCRLISRDDGINNSVFFEDAPPILAAATAEEIASRMTAVMDDLEDCAGIGGQGIAWIAEHHSADRMHHIQLTAFCGMPGRDTLAEVVCDASD